MARRSRLGTLLTRLMLVTLAAAAQVQLAASRKPGALRAVRLINLVFRAQVRARQGLAPSAYFTTLALCSAYDRIVREVPLPETIDAFAINFAVGVAHMYRGNYPGGRALPEGCGEIRRRQRAAQARLRLRADA